MRWTQEKIDLLNKLVGTMPSKDVAREIGCTEIALASARIKYCKTKLRRSWSKEDDEYLIKNRKKSNEEIARTLDRNEGAIAFRRKKLGIIKVNRWTKKEKKILAKTKKSIKEIACTINRSIEAITQAARRYGCVRKKKWSEKEIKELEKGYYKYGPQKMAKKLHRTQGAVSAKARELALDSCFDDMLTVHTLVRIIYNGKPNRHIVAMLIQEGLPFKVYPRKSKNYKMVELDKFWQWAEKNQDKLDFAKFNENDLGYEPQWVDTKRSQDRLKLHQQRWEVA